MDFAPDGAWSGSATAMPADFRQWSRHQRRDAASPGPRTVRGVADAAGQIIVDFLITEAPSGHGGGFLVDCPRALAQGLADKLGFYKLRAKVSVENLSDSLGVLAMWDGDLAVTPDLAFPDPRNAALGWRILAPAEMARKVAGLVGAA